MRLFLTGATGFIGSYVMATALLAGHEVVALRRRSESTPVIPLSLQPQWCTGSLATIDPTWFKDIDAVLHLASAGVSPKPAPWNVVVETNVLGSFRLFELAAAAGVRRFVVPGTCHEYGATARRYTAIPPDAPLEPINAYGASKAAAFQLLRAFSIQERLEFFYGRIFTAYGEGQFAGNFWPSLRCAALAGKDFLMTSGRQISDFIHVSAVAAHLLEACSRQDIIAGVPFVTNIGTGAPTSLLAFAEQEWSKMRAPGKLVPGGLPDRTDQIARYVPDLRGLLTATSKPWDN
jgi:nucleoside-diphosphate-sugar epimerase